MNKLPVPFFLILFLFAMATEAIAKTADNISQDGITWKFDKQYPVGQFVNGDWWVVGPVTVVSVTPGPATGPLQCEVDMATAIKDDVKDIKGTMHFVFGYVPPDLAASVGDMRMRNGSMVITKFGTRQGFDSRSKTYDPSCSISFPYKLDANRTLISTISNAYPIAGTVATKSCGRPKRSSEACFVPRRF